MLENLSPRFRQLSPADDHEEAIEGRVAVHDSDHVEVKLDFHLGRGERSRYRVETYFFLPRTLGINPGTYGRTQFYQDVQTYLRFKTPVIPLAQLADAASSASPLGEIRKLAEALRAAPRDRRLAERLSYELRMFGSVARAKIRDSTYAIVSRLDELDAAGDSAGVRLEDSGEVLTRFLDELQQLVGAWRAQRAALLDPALPRASQDGFCLVDEYLSLAIERKLAVLVRRIDALAGAGALDSARASATQLLLAERAYRSEAGYLGHWDGEDDGSLVYRLGMLKKLVTSVLWLEVDRQQDGHRVADMAAAVAAGIAMLFTVVASIQSARMWMLNSVGFVMAAVVIYMLKDRLKDWLKRYFHRRYARFLADYDIKMSDPLSGEQLGRSRESFSYVSEDSVPKDVLEIRRAGGGSPVEIAGKREVVFKYDKDIQLESRQLGERMHLESYDVNDITRFALRDMLARADDPEQYMPVYDPASDAVHERAFHKVYHLNIVMVLAAGPRGGEEVTTKHLRVMFDKQSIRGLQEVN